MKWTEVRERFLARYGTATVAPIMAAEQRRMTPSDTVQTYAQDKMRLLRAFLTDKQIDSALDALTGGMPPSYREILTAIRPKTYDDWLRTALSIENSRRVARNRWREVTPSVNVASQSNRQVRRRDESPPPPTPCRYCKERKIEAFHWHSKCPNRRPPPNVNAVTENESPREYLNSQGPH